MSTLILNCMMSFLHPGEIHLHASYYTQCHFYIQGAPMQAILLNDVVSAFRGLPSSYYIRCHFCIQGSPMQAITLDAVISASRMNMCHASGTVTMQLSMMHEYSIKTVCRNHSIQVAMCIYRAELYIALCDS